MACRLQKRIEFTDMKREEGVTVLEQLFKHAAFPLYLQKVFTFDLTAVSTLNWLKKIEGSCSLC